MTFVAPSAPSRLISVAVLAACLGVACGDPTAVPDDDGDGVPGDTTTLDDTPDPGDDTADTSDDGVDALDLDTSPDDGPVQGRFELVPGGETPFPFDLYTVPDATSATGRRLAVAVGQTELLDHGLDRGILPTEQLLETLNRLDGFGTFAHVALPVSDRIDETSLPTPEAALAGERVWIVDVDPDSPGLGETVEIDVSLVRDHRLAMIVLSPRTALRPATTYAALVTDAVLDTQGRPLQPSPVLRAALGLETLDVPPAELEAATSVMTPLVDAVDRTVLERVVTATVFTTQSRAETTAMHQAIVDLGDALEPTLEDPDGDGQPDLYTPATLPNAQTNLPDMTGVGPVVRGRVQMPGFRGEHGDVELDDQQRATVTETLDVGFVLALPDDETAQPFRIAVVQHGNGADKESAMHLAGHLARAGIATLAIDLPGHGDEDTPGNALEFTKPAVMRGAFLQAEANQMALFEAATRMGDLDLVPAGAPDGIPDLAVDAPLFYIGESLGGITGAVSTAVSARVEAAVFNVAGAGLRHMVGPLLGALLADDVALVQLEIMFQTFIDAADPISAVAPMPQRPTLAQIVVGDTLVSPAASESLAAGLALPLVCPCPDSAPSLDRLERVEAPVQGHGLSVFADSKHGVLLRDHDQFPASSDAMRGQIVEFLTPLIEGQPATVVDPFAP